jgi:2-dehydropantoate 2-reductase
MRYVIYGAGAIGATIGARLAASGQDVLLVARGAHLDALRRDGLRLQTPEAETTHRLPVDDGPGTVTDADTVLLTMKSQDTAAALDALAATASPAVVCAQNGVENERLALRRFDRVYGMLVFLGAQFLEPGVVQAYAAPVPGVLDVGVAPHGVDGTARRIAADLTAAGFASVASERIMAFKYAKLHTNMANGVDAVLGPEHRNGPVEEAAKAEARACFAAAGLDVATQAEMAERIGQASPMREVNGLGHQGSSAWQSLTRGTGGTEADYLSGEIALLGRLHGVRTPVNARLQRLAARAAREGLGPGAFTEKDVL